MADEAWKVICGIIRFILFRWGIVSVAIEGNGGTVCVAISIIIIVIFRFLGAKQLVEVAPRLLLLPVGALLL